MKLLALVVALLLGVLTSACGGGSGNALPFDTALIKDVEGMEGEVTLILWEVVTDDCEFDGLATGKLSPGALVDVTQVRNDCSPKMYFVEAEGNNGWVRETSLDPR